MVRLFLLWLLMANSNMSLLAQLIEPVLQTGHKQDITLVDVAFEKSVYLTGNKTELILWNSRNGWQLRKIAPGLAIIGASFTNDGTEVAVMCYEYGKISALLFYDVASGAFKDSVSFEETQMWGKRYPSLDELIVSASKTTMILRSFDEIFLVNCLSRSLTGHFKIPSYDSRLAFINDSTAMVASGDNKTIVQKMRLPQGEIIATKELHPSASPMAVQAYANGMLVLLKNKKLLQLDEQWQPKEEIALPENTSVSSYKSIAIVVSKNGDRAALAANERPLVLDLSNRQWIATDSAKNFFAEVLAFAHPDGSLLLAAGSNSAVIWKHGKKWQALNSLAGKTVEPGTIRYSGSGLYLSRATNSSWSGYSTVLNLATGKVLGDSWLPFVIHEWLDDSVALTSVSRFSGGDGAPTGVQIRNILTGKILHSISHPAFNKDADRAIISSDRSSIACIDRLNKKLLLANGNGYRSVKVYDLPEVTSTHIEFTPDGKKLILGATVIRILDIATRKWTALKDSASSYYIDRFTVTPDGSQLLYEKFDIQKGNQLYSYEIASGQYSQRRKYDTLASQVRCHPQADIYVVGFFNGTIELRSIATDTLLLRQKLFTGSVDEILFHDKGNRLTVLGDDGTTATIDLKRMEVLYNTALLFNNSDFGFALYTPENYYLVSPEFVNEMHFVKGTETYALTQFDLQLNRPDKVLEQIGYTDPELLHMYAKAYERRLQKAGFNVSSGGFKDLTPVICRSAELSGTITEDSTITLRWSTAASVADIAALRLYINGQIIKTISQPANEWTIPVSLNLGDNNIEASYLTKEGVESLPTSVIIQYAPAKGPDQKTIFIGIGVSQYQETAFNLTYAAKDAGDLSKKFQQSRDANIYTFLDAQVTRAMLDSIRRIVQSTSIHDQVILSFSGHGLTDNSYQFFFGSHDIDFTNPGAKGISYADITTLLDDVPARKKLILIDACHSGESDASVIYFGKATSDTQYVREKTRSTIGKKYSGGKMMNTVKLMEQYFADLSTASGTNVLSAAAGEEYALESSQWANGVFTYSVINGIFEKQADKNSDGKVMLSEIRKYVQEEVLKLTGGKQQPTSRNSNPRFDWAL